MLEQALTKIIIIGTYFGRWPIWFPAFLLSCAKNESIDWLFFTDCEIPQGTYCNIRFEQMDLRQLNARASEQLGFHIQKGSYSQADLQPAYGLIFEEYIKGFDFWGHCDIDVVWGDLRNFITENILRDYDIISCRKNFLAGHLTLWRNETKTNTLFRDVLAYREILSCKEYHNFDENIISTFLKSLISSGNSKIRVFWPEQMVVWFHGEINPIGWYWDNGKIFDAEHNEYIYLHFQLWKRFVTSIDFQVWDSPTRFKVTRFGIQSQRHFMQDLGREKLKWDLMGLISQFFARSLEFLRLLKRLLPVRDVFWAQRLTENLINSRDVQYERRTGNLRLKPLNLQITKQEYFLLEGYYAALQLTNQRGARFYSDGPGNLFVEISELRFAIQSKEDILTLKQLFVEGRYNMLFSRPVVVVDIGMSVGFASIFFASHPNAVVIGYEPCQNVYEQALYNIALNPAIADKIHAIKAGVGDAKFETIAHFLKLANQRTSFHHESENRMGPIFEYEEVQIEDAAEILDLIVTNYSGYDIIMKIDFEHSEYHIDGVAEQHFINRLATTRKLDLIEAIMLDWHRPKPEHSIPVIARQLSDYGFRVFLFSPYDAYEGMLYAVRGNV